MARILMGSLAIVANDYGLLHLAGAVGVPQIGLYGMTDPKMCGPLGEVRHLIRARQTARKVYSYANRAIDQAEARAVMKSIDFDEVMEAILKLIALAEPSVQSLSDQTESAC